MRVLPLPEDEEGADSAHQENTEGDRQRSALGRLNSIESRSSSGLAMMSVGEAWTGRRAGGGGATDGASTTDGSSPCGATAGLSGVGGTAIANALGITSGVPDVVAAGVPDRRCGRRQADHGPRVLGLGGGPGRVGNRCCDGNHRGRRWRIGGGRGLCRDDLSGRNESGGEGSCGRRECRRSHQRCRARCRRLRRERLEPRGVGGSGKGRFVELHEGLNRSESRSASSGETAPLSGAFSVNGSPTSEYEYHAGKHSAKA